MAQKPKTAKPKPDPIIEALQLELKRQGYYAGEVDGQAGGKTTEAVARRDAAAQRTEELRINALTAQGGKTTADADAAAAAVETARKQRYSDNASSGLGMLAQSSANLAAPAAGTAGGMLLGKRVNMAMDASQASRNRVLQGVADDRMAGRTTVEGARTGARLAGAMPLTNPAARTASRMLPHMGLGAVSIAKGAQVLSESDPNGEFYPRMADRGAGLGYIGVGAGLAKQGLRYAAAPGVAPDAKSLAIINSNQLRRNLPTDPPEAPPPKPLTPRGALAEQARAAGVKNIGKKNMGQLQAALDAINKGTKGAAIPLTAGALAYAMTPDRAEAADGSGGGGQAEALTNAAGATAATYGVGKALGAVPKVVGRAAGGALAGLMPTVAADAYDPTQEELNRDRNDFAQWAPSWARVGELEGAYQMAQVPTQAPEKISQGPRRPDFNQALADFEALMAGAQ